MNPTIPRASAPQMETKRKPGKASIASEFMCDDEVEYQNTPGPGEYLQEYQITAFGKNAILHEYP